MPESQQDSQRQSFVRTQHNQGESQRDGSSETGVSAGNEPQPDLERATGSDYSQNTFEKHAALLSDSRLSRPANQSVRAQLVQQLQRDYGNRYVQRLVDHSAIQRRQTLITEYFPPAQQQQQPQQQQPQQQQPQQQQQQQLQININHDDNGNWTAQLQDGTQVADFEYYEDEGGRWWINNVATVQAYQQMGIGRRMIQAAVDEYGAVYASAASKMEHEQYVGEDDTRYLSEEGAALVNSCITNNIMEADWFINPFLEEDSDDFEDDVE